MYLTCVRGSMFIGVPRCPADGLTQGEFPPAARGIEWNQGLETGDLLGGHTAKVQADVGAVQEEAKGKATS